MSMRYALLPALAMTTGLLAPAMAQDSAGWPRTIEHVNGSTELAAAPERIAVLSYVEFEIALSLGIIPVFAPLSGHNGTETRDYHDWALESLGGERPTFYGSSREIFPEVILTTDPDVILAVRSTNLGDNFQRLSDIAPVITADPDTLSPRAWQASLHQAASVLGREAEADRVIAEVEKRFEEIAAAHPEVAGQTLVFAMPRPNEIDFVTTGDDPSWDFFERLGFVLPEAAQELSAPDAGGVSLERFDLLEADILLLAFPFGDAGILNEEQMLENELFQRLDVVREGRFRVIPFEIASELAYPTPLSLNHTLDILEPILVEIVSGQ